MLKLVSTLLITLTLGSLALAHSWYPIKCCSDKDCSPIPCEQIVEQSEGTYKYLDYVFQASNVHPSLDRFCHACISESGTPLCLFIVQNS